MKKPNAIIILDDDAEIQEAHRYFIEHSRHFLKKGKINLSDYKFHAFSNDTSAREFVLESRNSILGYIQDIHRKLDVRDISGVTFYNQVIDCLTPWAKTLVVSACDDVSIPIRMFKLRGGENLRWLSKSENKLEIFAKHLKWLLEPTKIIAENIDKKTSKIIEVLSPAWDQLCGWLSKNPEYLHKMSPRDFELLAGEIFCSYGWEVDFTSRTRDGGYDLIATRRSIPSDISILVEVKRYSPNRPVGVGIVRSLYGIRDIYAASQVVLVTSSYVSSDAKKQYNRVIPWELDFIERDKIIEWCKSYKAGDVNGSFNVTNHRS